MIVRQLLKHRGNKNNYNCMASHIVQDTSAAHLYITTVHDMIKYYLFIQQCYKLCSITKVVYSYAAVTEK